MYGFKQLSQIYNTSDILEFDENSRFVLMSDCHRGDGSWADDFTKNQSICCAALNHYYSKGYTYIEIGDGDELWENSQMNAIIHAHKDVFSILSKFYKDGRMVMLYGNHDIVKKNCDPCKQSVFSPADTCVKEYTGFFKDISAKEGLVLKNNNSGCEIFLVHGHQVDFLNSFLWRFARFMVRSLWRRLEIFGVNDPTSAAKNNRKKDRIEKKMIRWVEKESCLVIIGHTHRPVFPEIGEPKYFNDGSCVHPDGITAIEIADANITLVKWIVKARHNGTLFIGRETIGGPTKLQDYFTHGKPLLNAH